MVGQNVEMAVRLIYQIVQLLQIYNKLSIVQPPLRNQDACMVIDDSIAVQPHVVLS